MFLRPEVFAAPGRVCSTYMCQLKNRAHFSLRGRHGVGVCDFLCSGDSQLMCGGDHAFDVYSIPVPEAHTASNYVGCFADDANDRIFVDKLDDMSSMTPEVCTRVRCSCSTCCIVIVHLVVVVLIQVLVYPAIAYVSMAIIFPPAPRVGLCIYYYSWRRNGIPFSDGEGTSCTNEVVATTSMPLIICGTPLVVFLLAKVTTGDVFCMYRHPVSMVEPPTVNAPTAHAMIHVYTNAKIT